MHTQIEAKVTKVKKILFPKTVLVSYIRFFTYKQGISAFLVPFETCGVEISPAIDKLGIRATSTCDITLRNVKLPKTCVIGGLGNGFEIAMKQLQLGRIGVAAQAIGIGQAAFELAVKYSRDRRVFGGRLCDKQLVKVEFKTLCRKIFFNHYHFRIYSSTE